MNEEMKDTIIETVDQLIESYQEYCETNQDYGDNYYHMPAEGGWSYNNCDEELKEFISTNEIETYDLDSDTLANIVLSNFEMQPRHIFGNIWYAVFNIDSYSIQEIEHHINLDYLSKEVGEKLCVDEVYQLLASERYAVHKNGSDLLLYTYSEIMWCAEISASTLQECINDYIN